MKPSPGRALKDMTGPTAGCTQVRRVGSLRALMREWRRDVQRSHLLAERAAVLARVQMGLAFLDGDRGPLAAFAADPVNVPWFGAALVRWGLGPFEDLHEVAGVPAPAQQAVPEPEGWDVGSPMHVALLMADFPLFLHMVHQARAAPWMDAEHWATNSADLAVWLLHACQHLVLAPATAVLCYVHCIRDLRVNVDGLLKRLVGGDRPQWVQEAHAALVRAAPAEVSAAVAAWVNKGILRFTQLFHFCMSDMRFLFEEFPHVYGVHCGPAVLSDMLHGQARRKDPVGPEQLKAMRYAARVRGLRWIMDEGEADGAVSASEMEARFERFLRSTADDGGACQYSLWEWMRTPTDAPVPGPAAA